MHTRKIRVLAAHPLRHHFIYTLRGIASSGCEFLVVVPWRVPRSVFILLNTFFPSRASSLRYYLYEGVPSDRFLGFWRQSMLFLRRLISPESMCREFDRICADQILRGEIKCDYIHVFQDYMPKTVQAADEVGIKVVSEQILNSSASVRRLAKSLAEQYNISDSFLDFAVTEDQNDMVLKVSTLVVCPSEFVISGLSGRYARSIVKIPYGVDLKKFGSSSKMPVDKEFRVVARSTTLRKGLPAFVDALLDLQNDIEFRKLGLVLRVDFLGDLQRIPSVQAKLVLLEKNSSIVMSHGNRSRDEVARLLNEAHVFILPSISEGMSLAVLEAVAAGAVSVISPNCGVDGFKNNVHGIVLTEWSSREIATALHRLIRFPHELEDMRRASLALMESGDWGQFEQKIGMLYRKLAD